MKHQSQIIFQELEILLELQCFELFYYHFYLFFPNFFLSLIKKNFKTFYFTHNFVAEFVTSHYQPLSFTYHNISE